MILVQRMTQVKAEHQIPYTEQCATLAVPYPSLMRWKSRVVRGVAVLLLPGPKKSPLMEPQEWPAKLQQLRHGQYRSSGTTALYQDMAAQVSRREIQRQVTEARQEAKRQRAAALTRITWQTPGLVWSMDDSAYRADQQHPPVQLHLVQDLGSRNKLPPVVSPGLLSGPAVAAHLKMLFKRYGAPLFLKRDNGSNLNHEEVNRVLEEALVLPLNSPSYYAPYNGGIERAQREVKEALATAPVTELRLLQLLAEGVVQDLNHRPRPCLDGQIPCRVFWDNRAVIATFTRPKRKEVYYWIKNYQDQLLAKTNNKLTLDEARRLAVQTWLLDHGHITMTTAQSVTRFREKNDS